MTWKLGDRVSWIYRAGNPPTYERRLGRIASVRRVHGVKTRWAYMIGARRDDNREVEMFHEDAHCYLQHVPAVDQLAELLALDLG